MDPTPDEQLSRYLDGDLDAAEARLLEARLAAEPELASELEALQRLQRQVHEVAERMEPPPELDAMLIPLQRGGPEVRRRIPPAVRWIGMAAGLALAVTVAIEVVRRPPEPPPAAPRRIPTPAPAPGPSEFFQLSPLPSPATPEGEELLGATDRLLASPLAEAPLPEPDPIDVRGPLSEEEAVVAPGTVQMEDKGGRAPGSSSAEERSADGTGKRQRSAPANEGLAATAPSAATSALETAVRPTRDELQEAPPPRHEAAKKQLAVTHRLILASPEGDPVAELELPATSAPRSVRWIVTIAGGVVVAVEPEGGDDADRDELAVLVGRTVPGVTDGRYRGAVEATAGSP